MVDTSPLVKASKPFARGDKHVRSRASHKPYWSFLTALLADYKLLHLVVYNQLTMFLLAVMAG